MIEKINFKTSNSIKSLE